MSCSDSALCPAALTLVMGLKSFVGKRAGGREQGWMETWKPNCLPWSLLWGSHTGRCVWGVRRENRVRHQPHVGERKSPRPHAWIALKHACPTVFL